MAAEIPSIMRSFCVFTYGDPSTFEVASIPTPRISQPDQVLVKVHAASINPADIYGAGGGWDLSGTVVAIGDAVRAFQVGDEVFGCLKFHETGSVSEYALTTEDFIVPKPKAISHVDAASLPLVTMTAIQGFDLVKGGLEGKTVLVTAGLGGVGASACQIAKNVLGAAKVITTVSTDKVLKVEQLLGPGVVDEVVDYNKSSPVTQIPHRSVDVLLDNSAVGQSYLPLLSSKTGSIINIKGGASGTSVKKVIPELPFWLLLALNITYYYSRFRIWYQGGVQWDAVLQKPNKRDLEKIALWIEEGKLKAVVGKVLTLEDVPELRETCVQMLSGKGGLGKVVVEIN